MAQCSAFIHLTRTEKEVLRMAKGVFVVDNRDAQEMFGYLEARVETMKRRIQELERENELLHRMLDSECDLTHSV